MLTQEGLGHQLGGEGRMDLESGLQRTGQSLTDSILSTPRKLQKDRSFFCLPHHGVSGAGAGQLLLE